MCLRPLRLSDASAPAVGLDIDGKPQVLRHSAATAPSASFVIVAASAFNIASDSANCSYPAASSLVASAKSSVLLPSIAGRRAMLAGPPVQPNMPDNFDEMIDTLSTAQPAPEVTASDASAQSDVSGASAASIGRLMALAEHHGTIMEC